MTETRTIIGALGLAALLLGGCATTGPGAPVSDAGEPDQPSQTTEPETRPESRRESTEPSGDNGGWQITQPQDEPEPQTAPPRSSGPNSAVVSLLNQAAGYYQQNDYPRAIASAERALRIDRRSAEAYLVLAKSYYQSGDETQAAQFARQGLRYSGDNRKLDRALNSVLADVE
ncbi:tetratricopeptide repeat protein [Gilvimarinus xylanilyticus]|uniref:Tetratricopeptide repeat protein n=1 Tax=Gilvimarinus xylanilyticus TaxID=2944139 RepID=A0A9X2KTB6_9GAMM|nr:tetratricopeptide repeat protein [Gilvimarinus xylanilyticus]MCP8899099.1 tetratricopeptide repeat protein [Gilvimarinus xylanilyticus]